MFEAQDAEVGDVLDTMDVGVLEEGHGEGRLVCLGCGAIVEVHLGHTLGGNWHDNLPQEVSVVIGGEGGRIDSVADEAIIEVALSLVDIGLVVVAKRELREVAVEVEDNIAINVNKEVALALLGVDEAVNLQTLVQVVGLAALKRGLVLWPGEGCLNLGLLIFIGVLEAEELLRRCD